MGPPRAGRAAHTTVAPGAGRAVLTPWAGPRAGRRRGAHGVG